MIRLIIAGNNINKNKHLQIIINVIICRMFDGKKYNEIIFMARAGITYHEVSKAISALQGTGKRITIENVRQQLGTGSHTTISHHINTWRKENESGLLGLNENLPEEVLAFTKGLWQRLHEAAQTEITACQQQSDKKIQETQQSLIETIKQLEGKKTKLHEVEEKLQQALKSENDLTGKINQSEQENSRLKERVANQEKHLMQWETKYDKLHELLKNTQKNLEHYQEESQKLREKQALLIANNEQAYQIKLDELLKKYLEELNKKAYFEAELKRVEKLNGDLQLNNETLNQFNKNLEQENQSIKMNLHYLEKQNEKIENQNKTQQEALKQNENLLTELKLENKNTKEEIDHLKKLLENNEDKIKILRQDNLFLTQEKSNLAGQFKQFQEMMKES